MCLSIYVRPKLFYELGEKRKKIGKKNGEKKSQKYTNSAYNMLGVSIAAVKQKNPTYHSLPLEK